MATKKQKKAQRIQAKKKQQKRKMTLLGVIVALCVGFLIFFFITLFDSLYPPTTDRATRTAVEEKEQMTLYFADANERFLVPELRYITNHRERSARAKALVAALIEGSTMGGMRTVPAETELIDISIKDDGTAIVNFGRNLVDMHPGGSASEVMTIYSVTNTILQNIPSLERVSFRVEGRPLKTLKGHMDTEFPFVMNEDLVIRERS